MQPWDSGRKCVGKENRTLAGNVQMKEASRKTIVWEDCKLLRPTLYAVSKRAMSRTCLVTPQRREGCMRFLS